MADRVGEIHAEETRPRRNTHDRISNLESSMKRVSSVSEQQYKQITMQLGALQNHIMRSFPPGDNEDEDEEGDPNILRISEVIDVSQVPDYHIKIIVLGDSAVGKTSYINTLYNVPFDMAPQTTIIAEVRKRNLFIGNHTFSVALWDTAGQEQFRSIVAQYFRQVHGTLLIYDVTNRESFNHLEDWIDELDRNFKAPVLATRAHTSKRRGSKSTSMNGGPSDGSPVSIMNGLKLSKSRESMASNSSLNRPTIILVGNKIDMGSLKVVTSSEGKRFAREHNIPFFETSAKTNQGIRDAFAHLLASLYKRAKFSRKVSPRGHVPITLEDMARMQREGGRCCGG